MEDYRGIKDVVYKALSELSDRYDFQKNEILVVGCSTSEIAGERIGSHSNIEIARYLMEGILSFVREKEIFLAIQCCEHLNRALVVEEDCARYYNLEGVSVYPSMKAGGSMGQTAMEKFKKPIVVEAIRGHAALDIGDTLVGMHLKAVAVPFRFSMKEIGNAHLTGAYTRPKLIGGERAVYHKP
ncbi:MAG: TIGR01440 family protein [Peptostreptococcaceae bacterium]|nr:TIGR01440 family protein [Peptostreptococcaceae bacterium]